MSMTRRWSLLTAVLIVGILAASWFLLVSPKRSDAAGLRNDAAKQKVSNDALVQSLNELKAQSLDLPKAKAELAMVLPVPTPQQQQKVMAQAQNISQTAKSCDDMAKIAHEQAPQTSTQSPSIRAGDLPAELRSVVLGLKVSEASKPMPTRGGIGIIMVCKRTDPSVALPTQDQVYDELMHARLDQISRRYLRDLRRSAYVDIRG